MRISAGRGTLISTASTISACVDWQTGAVPKLSKVWVLWPIWTRKISTIFSTTCNCGISTAFSMNLCPWNLGSVVIHHLVNTLQLWSSYCLLNSLVHGDLSLRHDRHRRGRTLPWPNGQDELQPNRSRAILLASTQASQAFSPALLFVSPAANSAKYR